MKYNKIGFALLTQVYQIIHIVGFKEHTSSTLMKTSWDITGDGGAGTPGSGRISKVLLTQEL